MNLGKLLIELYITGFYLHITYVVTLIPLMLIFLWFLLYGVCSFSLGTACKASFLATGAASLCYMILGICISFVLIFTHYPPPSLDYPPLFYALVTFGVAGIYSSIQAAYIYYYYTTREKYGRYLVICGISSCVSASIISAGYIQLFG